MKTLLATLISMAALASYGAAPRIPYVVTPGGTGSNLFIFNSVISNTVLTNVTGILLTTEIIIRPSGGDDSPTIQAAVNRVNNSVAGARYTTNWIITLTSGAFRLNSTVQFTNCQGITFRGSGMFATTLSVYAAGPGLRTEGLWYSKFSDFQISGETGHSGGVIEIDGYVNGHDTVQGNTYDHIYVRGNQKVGYGWSICPQGGNSSQGSEQLWLNCHIASCTNAGLYINGYNALANTFIGGNINTCYHRGAYVIGGSIMMQNVGFQNGTELQTGYDVAVQGGAFTPSTFYNCRSESLRFVGVTGAPAIIDGCAVFAAIAGWQASHAYTASNLVFKAGWDLYSPGLYWRCVTNGVSGTNEPDWKYASSKQIIDGTTVWDSVDDYTIVLEYGGAIRSTRLGAGITYALRLTSIENCYFSRHDWLYSQDLKNVSAINNAYGEFPVSTNRTMLGGSVVLKLEGGSYLNNWMTNDLPNALMLIGVNNTWASADPPDNFPQSAPLIMARYYGRESFKASALWDGYNKGSTNDYLAFAVSSNGVSPLLLPPVMTAADNGRVSIGYGTNIGPALLSVNGSAVVSNTMTAGSFSGDGVSLTNIQSTNVIGLVAGVWTNDGTYTWLAGQPVPTTNVPGPAMFFSENGSLYFGTNVYQDTSLVDPARWKMHQVSMVDSNEPAIGWIAFGATDSEDYNYYGQLKASWFADPTSASSYLTIESDNAANAGGHINLRTDATGPSILLKNWTNDIFKVDVDGSVTAGGVFTGNGLGLTNLQTSNIVGYAGGVTSFNTRTGAVVLTSADVTNALPATLTNNITGTSSGVSVVSDPVVFQEPYSYGSGGNLFTFNGHVNTFGGSTTFMRTIGNLEFQLDGVNNILEMANTAFGDGSSHTMRGLYYHPNITSYPLTNANQINRAIETETGDVIIGTTSGNVGIGTTSPSERLTVIGNQTVSGNITATNTITGATVTANKIMLTGVNDFLTNSGSSFSVQTDDSPGQTSTILTPTGFVGNGSGLSNVVASHVSGTLTNDTTGNAATATTATSATNDSLARNISTTYALLAGTNTFTGTNTFQDLTADSITITNGGTVGAALLSTSTATNSPAATELATAGWVRGLFDGAGVSYYNTANLAPAFTNSDYALGTNYSYNTTIPAYGSRTYLDPSNAVYFGSVTTTNKFLAINSGITVNAYFSVGTDGTGTAGPTVKPEIYVSYDGTNWLGAWDAQTQNIPEGGTNLYSWVISNPQYTTTNATGFYVQRRLKMVTQTSPITSDVTVHFGTNFASHIAMSSATSVSGNAYLAADQTFTGNNVFTQPMTGSGSGLTNIPVTGIATPSRILTNAEANTVTINNAVNATVFRATQGLDPGILTVATLPEPQPGQTCWASDVITSRGSGGIVTYDGSNWRTRDGVIATANLYQWFLNARAVGLIAQTPVGFTHFGSEMFSAQWSLLNSSGAGTPAGSLGFNNGVNVYGSYANLTTSTDAAGTGRGLGFLLNAATSTDTNAVGCSAAATYLCDGTDKYWCTIGLDSLNTSVTAWPTNGAFFAYDMYNVNSIVSNATFSATWTNNWIAVSSKAATFSYNDTGLPVTTDNTAPNRLVLAYSLSEIVWFTNGVACVTNATAGSIPTVSMSPHYQIQKTAGTTSRGVLINATTLISRHAARVW